MAIKTTSSKGSERGFSSERSERFDRSDRGEGGKKTFGKFSKPRPGRDVVFDYKDFENLRQFTSEDGRVVPRRINRLNAKQQRELTRQIKRAQNLAFLPFCDH